MSPAVPHAVHDTHGRAQAYFQDTKKAFTAATHRTGLVTQCFLVGQKLRLRLHCAGPALVEKLTRAMQHIACPDQGMKEDTLDVFCWESASTGTPMPPPPWPATAYGQKGHIIGYSHDDLYCCYQPGLDILTMLHRPTRQALYWTQTPDTIPYWEASFPMRGIIHWWSLGSPYQLMHAGAVGFEKGGVLLAGKSGSGKSTTALSCLSSRLLYASDDYVLVRTGENPFVHSLYSTAKLEPDNLFRLPGLRDRMTNAHALGKEKALFYVAELFPDRISTGFPLRAIMVPRITDGKDTCLTPAQAADALFALAPTTVMHLEGGSREVFDKISAFVRSVPCFWLNLGSDMTRIAPVIEDALQGFS